MKKIYLLLFMFCLVNTLYSQNYRKYKNKNNKQSIYLNFGLSGGGVLSKTTYTIPDYDKTFDNLGNYINSINEELSNSINNFSEDFRNNNNFSNFSVNQLLNGNYEIYIPSLNISFESPDSLIVFNEKIQKEWKPQLSLYGSFYHKYFDFTTSLNTGKYKILMMGYSSRIILGTGSITNDILHLYKDKEFLGILLNSIKIGYEMGYDSSNDPLALINDNLNKNKTNGYKGLIFALHFVPNDKLKFEFNALKALNSNQNYVNFLLRYNLRNLKLQF